MNHIIKDNLFPLAPIRPDIDYRANLADNANIKAVLFDIYGTLLVSGVGDIGITASTNSLASIKQHQKILPPILDMTDKSVESVQQELKDIIRIHHNRTRQQSIEYPEVDIRDIWIDYFKSQNCPNIHFEQIEEVALRYELLVNPVWPMPGFPQIIHELDKAGFRLGIVSNAQFYTPLILEVLCDASLEELGFQSDLCAWSWQIRQAKPSKELFAKPLNTLKQSNVQPENVLFVGNDMLNDIQTAASCGCKTCLFAGDERSLRLRAGDSRITFNPDIVIDDLFQLQCLIGESKGNG